MVSTMMVMTTVVMMPVMPVMPHVAQGSVASMMRDAPRMIDGMYSRGSGLADPEQDDQYDSRDSSYCV